MDVFANSTALRLLAGALFFVPFSWAFFRLSRGLGRALFALLCGALAALFILSPALHLLAFLPLALFIYAMLRRPSVDLPPYQPAVAIVESGGIKRGLTAAEAAVVLEARLPRVLSVVLVGLLKKGVVRIAGEEPLVVALDDAYRFPQASQDAAARSAHRRAVAQARNVVLHPYEEPFLVLIEESDAASLKETNFTAPTRALIQQVAKRVRGHDLDATRAYYRKHLGRARHDLQVALPGEPAKRAQEQFLEWMLLDEDIAGLFAGYRRPWVAALNGESQGDVTAAVRRLASLLAGAVPPGALQVRWGAGEGHAIGGEDEVTAAYLSAVISQLK